MRKALVTLVVLSAGAGGGYAYYRYRQTPTPPNVATATVTRGDLADRVGATGTLQAVTTVQVGTQVSGTIQSLHADFNSLVRKGQVIARLDPSLFQTQVEQARANFARSQADVERFRVALDDMRTKLTRARELAGRQLLPRSELEAAEVATRSAEAQLRSADAQVTQAQASLNQAAVNHQHTIITAPIDGLVISRNVDVGQTVAASMQAPTLFVLAADLTKMQVVANLDESDVGRIRPGQTVTFRVDAYPSDDFSGKVAQVRLQPIVQQNVVTYATVIDVPNPSLKLKPGMTANVNIEIARRAQVLRVPNTALRFRPSNELFAALGQAPPVPGGRNRGGEALGEGHSESPAAAPEPRRAPEPPRATARPVEPPPAAAPTDVKDGARRGRLQERPSRGGAMGAANASLPARTPQATTVDALFGPLPTVESMGRVWIMTGGKLAPARVRLGITDGQMTELLEAQGIDEGTALVTNVTVGNATTRPAANTTFPPFIGGQPGRFGGPGGFGGGGGGSRGGGGGR